MTITPSGALTRKWIVLRDPSSVALMRRRVVGKLTAWDLSLPPEVDDDVRLIVSELVTNAVRYDTSDLPILTIGLVVASNRSELYVEVLDGTPPEAALNSRPDPDGQPSESGRGLMLVAMLAKRWGIEPTEGGKRVWATVALPAAHRLTDRARDQLRARMRAAAPRLRIGAFEKTAAWFLLGSCAPLNAGRRGLEALCKVWPADRVRMVPTPHAGAVLAPSPGPPRRPAGQGRNPPLATGTPPKYSRSTRLWTAFKIWRMVL